MEPRNSGNPKLPFAVLPYLLTHIHFDFLKMSIKNDNNFEIATQSAPLPVYDALNNERLNFWWQFIISLQSPSLELLALVAYHLNVIF